RWPLAVFHLQCAKGLPFSPSDRRPQISHLSSACPGLPAGKTSLIVIPWVEGHSVRVQSCLTHVPSDPPGVTDDKGKQRMPEPADRRSTERFPVNADTSCSFLGPVVEDFGSARIRNISMEGLGVLLTRRVEPGTLLAVTLSNPARKFS